MECIYRDRPILSAVPSALLNSFQKGIWTTIFTCRASEFIFYSKSTPYVITNASNGITTLALAPFRLPSNYRYSLCTQTPPFKSFSSCHQVVRVSSYLLFSVFDVLAYGPQRVAPMEGLNSIPFIPAGSELSCNTIELNRVETAKY